MHSRRFLLGCILFVAAINVAAQGKTHALAETGMKPGLWEVATAVEMSDSTDRRNVTSRLCYAGDEAAAPMRVLPPHRGLGMKCQVQDLKTTQAPSITWKVVCKGKGGTFAGSGSMVPGPTSYTAETRLEQKSARKSSAIDEKTTGRWVGECK
jgi:Protein of unknown function (DUF3617)